MDKNVYILGAGFSKGLGLPLQDELLLFAKTVFFKDNDKFEHFKSVFTYQDKLSKMRKYLNYPLWNLEQLFNLVEMNNFYSKEGELSEIKKNFIQLIVDTILECTPDPFDTDTSLAKNKLNLKYTDRSLAKFELNPKYNDYLNFLNMFIEENENSGIKLHNDTIISFNYDLVIETVACVFNLKKLKEKKDLANSGIKLNCTFGKNNIKITDLKETFGNKYSKKDFPPYADISPFALDNSPDRAIKLIKLHGSINWKTDDGEIFIVPPTWNKSDAEIKKLWEIAYEELKQAKRIIVIGYSFPETDIYVKSLLALAVNENKILQNIYFINPDKDNARRSSLSLLDKNFERYCEYKEWSFQDFVQKNEGTDFIKEKLGRKVLI